MWSYTGDPASSDKDAVRFRVGDTDEEDPQLQDEEINYLIAERGSPESAAIAACVALQAKYARRADQKTGDISVSYSQRSAHYKELAATLRSRLGILAQPYAGGISISDREIDDEDTDRVDPAFEVSGMDHDGSRETAGEDWES